MAGIVHRRGWNGAVLAVVLLGAWPIAGCRVLTIDEDRAIRARQGGDFDETRYVDGIWGGKVLPAIAAAAVPLDTLIPAIGSGSGLDRAGASSGRRVGEGSAWTFVVRGAGRVTDVDAGARRGSATVALSGGGTTRLQIGPVVQGTAIRDALPFVAFNDFTDQLVFAEVGRALTARALAGVRPAIARLRPGQSVRFVGVANVRESGDPLSVTPVRITIDEAGSHVG